MILLVLLALLLPSWAFAQPSYISSLADYQVRALSGSFAPTNGTTSIASVTSAEWLAESGTGSLSGTIAAWSGGFKAISGNKLFVFGGGHTDSANNGIHEFDFSGTSAPVGWRVASRSTVANVTLASDTVNADGRMISVHTYDGTLFSHTNNTGYRFSGAPASPNGRFPATAVKFNFTTNVTTVLPNIPFGGGTLMTLYDPTSAKIMVAQGNNFNYAVLNTATDTWSAAKTSATSFPADDQCGAYDTLRSRGVLLGDGGASRLVTMNWSTEVATVSTIAPTGSTSILGVTGISCFYDASRDVYWLLGGAAASSGWTILYEMNAATFVITAHTLTGNAISIERVDMVGSYGRYVFMPAYRAIGVIASTTSPAYVIKLPAAAAAAFTSFTLTSTSTGTKPFTIGHAFKQGDVPSGQTVVSSDAVSLQANIQNVWPDGSAKFAILSGRAALVAATPKTINLTLDVPPGGSALTEANLTSTGVTASIQFGATCTVNLSSLIGATSTLSAGRMTAGRVRTFASGPVMSNWIYYSRCGSDPHLSVWFDVRLYSSNEVEIVPWIENSTLNIASPAAKTATATFVMAGTTRYSVSLTFPHHSRAVLASGTTLSHWSGTAPAVTPKHDITYFQNTKMVPAYYGTSFTAWGRVASTYTPQTQAQIPYLRNDMGGTGYGIFIGLLPEWEVAYITSNGDARAYNGAIINAYAVGGQDIHFRDELTNQPPKFSSFPNTVIGNNEGSAAGASTNNTLTPTPADISGRGWDNAHHPSIGYFCYLLTGRFWCLEESQFNATLQFLNQTDDLRGFTQGILRSDVGALTTRGSGWAIRTLAQASAITPDGDALATEFRASFASNVVYYHTKYIAQASNPLGIIHSYDDYNGGATPWIYSPWMEDFTVAAWGLAIDIAPGLSATNQAKLTQFFAWHAQATVGRLGGAASNQFYFADAAQYNLPLGPNAAGSTDYTNGTGPWWANWAAAYKPGCTPGACVSVTPPAAPADGALRGGNFPDGTSYWGNLQPAIAYAVNQNVSGAVTAYNRMIGASNWASILSTWTSDPVWGVKPREVGVPPPVALLAPTNVAVGP